MKKITFVKFDESVNISINLNNTSKNTYNFKKTIFLPYKTGKKNKLLVLVNNRLREKVKKLGITYVGGKDLIKNFNKKDFFKFNHIISEKKYMDYLLEFADILGKKNLIPNYDNSTIVNNSNNLEVIKNFNDGKNLSICPDKYGIIHLTIGKIKSSIEDIVNNYKHIINILRNINIGNSYLVIKNIYINTTMSPSLKLN